MQIKIKNPTIKMSKDMRNTLVVIVDESLPKMTLDVSASEDQTPEEIEETIKKAKRRGSIRGR